MRTNRTKEKLQAGQSVYGLICNITDPAMVEIAGLLNFDFVIIDGEHGPIDLQACENMIRASDSTGITPIVRVAINLPQNILRYLDAGALGVMLPMINSQAEAQSVVGAVKYPPMGNRGLAGVRANSYGLTTETLADYVKTANKETLVIVQIETTTAVNNLEGILKVDGVDVLFVGPTDLSSSMGYPGQPDQPEVSQIIKKLASQINENGKVAATIGMDTDSLKSRKDEGYRLIATGATALMAKASRHYLSVAHES